MITNKCVCMNNFDTLMFVIVEYLKNRFPSDGWRGQDIRRELVPLMCYTM